MWLQRCRCGASGHIYTSVTPGCHDTVMLRPDNKIRKSYSSSQRGRRSFILNLSTHNPLGVIMSFSADWSDVDPFVCTASIAWTYSNYFQGMLGVQLLWWCKSSKETCCWETEMPELSQQMCARGPGSRPNNQCWLPLINSRPVSHRCVITFILCHCRKPFFPASSGHNTPRATYRDNLLLKINDISKP